MNGLRIIWTSCLLLGCGDSLFDSTGGDSKDAGASGIHDASESDAPASDAAPVVNTCPEPCLGDAVADFDMSQGGSNDRWFYVQDSRSTTGLEYPELETGTVAGAPAWVSATSPAAIINCAQNQKSSVCEGTANHLVFIPSAAGGSDTDPALSYRVPADGTYVFSGQARSQDSADTSLSQRFLLSRNARHDLLHSKSFATSTNDETFAITVSALAGERISLTLLPNDSDTPQPVAFQVFVTLVEEGEGAFPGPCLFAATFDGANPFIDRCQGTALENLNDNVGEKGVSADTASAGAQYDRARQVSEGQFLRSAGAPLDYSGDFTVQFWAKLDALQPTSFATLYADWGSTTRGGVNLGYVQENGILEAGYVWNDSALSVSEGYLTGDVPSDGGWHFYRLSRGAAGISLCIDSIHHGTDPGPGTFNMTSSETPHIGRNVNYNPAYFSGAIDDVRVVRRALPCQAGD